MYCMRNAVKYPTPRVLVVLLALAVCGSGFSADAEFDWRLPAGFRTPPVPADNPMNAAKVELGRRLFYDQRMSINGKGSCSSCHLQEYGFTDQKPTAIGVTGEKHPRRAMALANVAYFAIFNWANPTIKHLEQQALTPLFGRHPVELGLPEGGGRFLDVIATDPMYKRLFPEAFPGEQGPYSFDHVVRAIACFERTLISGRSPYDRYRFQGDGNAISEAAKRGEDMFFHQPYACFRCHGGFTFGGSTVFQTQPTAAPEFFNTGLYNLSGEFSFPKDNLGLFDFTHSPEDIGKYNAPSLRNVAVRPPYMHDGSITTLDGVLDHYAAGGRTIASGPLAGDGSKNPNKSSHIGGFPITAEQRRDLIAFLESLTDEAFIHDPRFADPWPAVKK
jgi:cytochrome c peroxidase